MEEPESVDYRDIPSKLKMEYQHPSDLKVHKLRDQLSVLLAHIQKPAANLHEIMTEAANLIMRQFSLKQVCIAMKDGDGIYRYGTNMPSGLTCWMLNSYGPDTTVSAAEGSIETPYLSAGSTAGSCDAGLVTSALTDGHMALIYDPTNGTTSLGQIIRTGP